MTDVPLIDLAAIRGRSLAIARQLGCATNPSLPLLEEPLTPRPQESVAARALSLHSVVAASCGFPSSRSLEWLLREGLVDTLTSQERKFLQERDSDNVVFQTQAEALWVFAWVFSKVEALDFAQPCQNYLVTLYPDLHKNENSEEWRITNRYRDRKEIIESCDLAYCLHWAVNQARLERKKFPPFLSPLIILERRRALEWILGQDEWDSVPLDT